MLKKWMPLTLVIFPLGMAVLLLIQGPPRAEWSRCEELTPAQILAEAEHEIACVSDEGGEWVGVCGGRVWETRRCPDEMWFWTNTATPAGNCRKCSHNWSW